MAIRCSGTLIVVRRHFVWGGVVVLVVEFLARPKKDLFHDSGRRSSIGSTDNSSVNSLESRKESLNSNQDFKFPWLGLGRCRGFRVLALTSGLQLLLHATMDTTRTEQITKIGR